LKFHFPHEKAPAICQGYVFFKLKGFNLLTYINNGWKKIVKNVPIQLLRNKLYPDSGAFSYLDDYIDHSI
jgi:hypothetical protein